MITKEELDTLIAGKESFRVEKTISTTNMDKFCEAICAFANDMPNSRQCGYLLIGVTDDGKKNGLVITDDLQKKIASIRMDGNILPMPVMNVSVFHYADGDVLVVEVTPSALPPVRYRGRTFIRIGPRKDLATKAEEDILTERRSFNFPTWDNTPCCQATLEDIDTPAVADIYLPKAVDAEIISANPRSISDWMISLRMFNRAYNCPTYAGIVLFGKDPRAFIPGAYIQYVRWNGCTNAAEILNQRVFQGNLCRILPQLDSFIDLAIVQQRPVPISSLQEKVVYNYPKWALREILMNAVMHRDYNGNAPVRFYQYDDRIEIINHGGLYGKARPENFPTVNDYRNPSIAEGMQVLGYANMLNHGIPAVQQELMKNGNGQAIFTIDRITVFEAKITQAREWPATTQSLPNSLPNPLPNPLPEILQLMQENPNITYTELANRLHISRESIRKHLKTLREKHQLITRVGGTRGSWVTHTRPEK